MEAVSDVLTDNTPQDAGQQGVVGPGRPSNSKRNSSYRHFPLAETVTTASTWYPKVCNIDIGARVFVGKWQVQRSCNQFLVYSYTGLDRVHRVRVNLVQYLSIRLLLLHCFVRLFILFCPTHKVRVQGERKGARKSLASVPAYVNFRCSTTYCNLTSFVFLYLLKRIYYAKDNCSTSQLTQRTNLL